MSEDLNKLARSAAQLGNDFIEAARQGNSEALAAMLEPGSTAALLFEMFGAAIFQIDLRLEDAQEQNQLAPYDFQIEDNVGLLELGVLKPLENNGAEDGRPHFRRIFGSSLLLSLNGDGQSWCIADLLPVNSDGKLDIEQAIDRQIMAVHRGEQVLPLRLNRLDPVEKSLLLGMQKRTGKYNLEEMVNALRLWRDFKARRGSTLLAMPQSWAAGAEYLISLFDFGQADAEALGLAYLTEAETVENCAREIAQNLRANQFDDRYSLHPDPVGHYQTLFKELGISPERDEKVQSSSQQKVFDSIEVPPDDTDFFGPS